MKARVKATGEIVEVTRIVDMYVMTRHPHTIAFEKDELDFNVEDDLDYWTRLEHQYAGMAMQGMIINSYLAGEFMKDPNNGIKDMSKIITKAATVYAHALVEKLKSE